MTASTRWAKCADDFFAVYSTTRNVSEKIVGDTVAKVAKVGNITSKVTRGLLGYIQEGTKLAGRVSVVGKIGSHVHHGGTFFTAVFLPAKVWDCTTEFVEHLFAIKLRELVKHPQKETRKARKKMKEITWAKVLNRTKACGTDLVKITSVAGKALLTVCDIFKALEHFGMIAEAAVSWVPIGLAVGGVLSVAGLVNSVIQEAQIFTLRVQIQSKARNGGYDAVVELLGKQSKWTLERVGLKGWKATAKDIQAMTGTTDPDVKIARSIALTNNAKKMLNRKMGHLLISMTTSVIALTSLGIVVGTVLSGGTLAPATFIALGILGGISLALGVGDLVYEKTLLNNSGDPSL